MSSPPSRSRRPVLLMAIAAALVAAAVILVVSLVASPSRTHGNYSVTDNAVTIDAAPVGNLGTILVSDQGFALYMFPPDEQRNVTCIDRCALNWPPVIVPDGARVAAGAGVDPTLLSTITDRDGKRVATYNGWPLYLFAGDVAAGTATGQNQYLDGGYWYVIRPSGDVVKPVPQQ